MTTTILNVFFGCLLIQGIITKSIQNGTINDSNLVTIEVLENWKKNMTDYITEMFERESKSQRKRIFFHVRMTSSDITYNKNSIIKLSGVLSNEGNHFTPGDSIFISPVSGVYLFSWSTQTTSGKHVNTELRVNNVIKDTLHASLGSSVGTLSFTRMVICKVNKNEHVWIQTSRYYTENFLDYCCYSRSTFIGVLLYEI